MLKKILFCYIIFSIIPIISYGQSAPSQIYDYSFFSLLDESNNNETPKSKNKKNSEPNNKNNNINLRTEKKSINKKPSKPTKEESQEKISKPPKPKKPLKPLKPSDIKAPLEPISVYKTEEGSRFPSIEIPLEDEKEMIMTEENYSIFRFFMAKILSAKEYKTCQPYYSIPRRMNTGEYYDMQDEEERIEFVSRYVFGLKDASGLGNIPDECVLGAAELPMSEVDPSSLVKSAVGNPLENAKYKPLAEDLKELETSTGEFQEALGIAISRSFSEESFTIDNRMYQKIRQKLVSYLHKPKNQYCVPYYNFKRKRMKDKDKYSLIDENRTHQFIQKYLYKKEYWGEYLEDVPAACHRLTIKAIENSIEID